MGLEIPTPTKIRYLLDVLASQFVTNYVANKAIVLPKCPSIRVLCLLARIEPGFVRNALNSYRRRRPRGENHNDDPIDACVFSTVRETGVP